MLTTWGASQVISSWFGRRVTPPTSFWIGLVIDEPEGPSATGITIVEPTDAAYVRLEVPNNAANWSDPTVGVSSNLLRLTWPNVPVLDWGLISYYALCDAATNGNVYLWDDLREARQVSAGDPKPFFDAGAFAQSAA